MATTPKQRRDYSEDLKRKAISRIVNGEAAVAVAKDMKLPVGRLYAWQHNMRKELRNSAHIAAKQAPTPTGLMMRDAIVFLKHAQTEMTAELKSGRIKTLSKANLYALMALETLIGVTT